MQEINLTVANKNFNADYYYKGTKSLFGFSSSVVQEKNEKFVFKTEEEDLTPEEQKEEVWDLWDGTSMPLSAATLMVANEYNQPVTAALTPGKANGSSLSALFQ